VRQSACQCRRTFCQVAAVDAAGGDDDGLAEGLEGFAAALQHAAAAADAAHQGGEALDAVAEMHRQLRCVGMVAQPRDELHRQLAAGAPDDVEARHGIALRVQAALDPVRHREEADAVGLQPEIDLVVAAPGVGLGPAPRPMVVRPELGEGAPVGEGLGRGVLDAVLLLLAAADDEDAAEALLGQAAEVFLLVAVEDRHAAAGLQQLQRGADAGQAAADDDDVALVGSHAFSSVPDVGPARVVVVCFCP
jgi:hypothetical protein